MITHKRIKVQGANHAVDISNDATKTTIATDAINADIDLVPNGTGKVLYKGTEVATGAGGGPHAGDHTTGQTDEIDGDKLDIDFTPSSYAPSTAPAEADNVDNLTAHLAGIDTKIGDSVSHIASSANPHSTTKGHIGLSLVPNVYHVSGQTIDPDAFADSDSDFSAGSTWINTTADTAWVCLDATPANAIWHQVDGAAAAHAGDHLTGGGDEIDGDKLDIDYTPDKYTPTTAPAEADNVDNLTAHLAGINSELGTAQTHASNTSNPHTVTKSQVGLSNVENTKHNFAGTTNPVNDDDNTAGFSVGSVWVDTVTAGGQAWVCVDSTTSAAIWHQIDLSGGGIASLVEDTTPQLGGNLDQNGFQVINSIVVSEDVSAGDTLYRDPTDQSKAIKGGAPWEVGATANGDTTAVAVVATPEVYASIALSSNKAVFVWMADDGSAGGQIVCMAKDWNTATLTQTNAGNLLVIDSGGSGGKLNPVACKIGTDKILVCWKKYDATASNQNLVCRVVDFSGVTASLAGSEVVVDSLEVDYVPAVKADNVHPNRAVVAYKRNNSTQVYFHCIHRDTHAEGTITFTGSPVAEETLTIDGASHTYTAKTSGAVAANKEFNIGGSDTDRANSLATAINTAEGSTFYATALVGVVTVKFHQGLGAGDNGKVIDTSGMTSTGSANFAGGVTDTPTIGVGATGVTYTPDWTKGMGLCWMSGSYFQDYYFTTTQLTARQTIIINGFDVMSSSSQAVFPEPLLNDAADKIGIRPGIDAFRTAKEQVGVIIEGLLYLGAQGRLKEAYLSTTVPTGYASHDVFVANKTHSASPLMFDMIGPNHMIVTGEFLFQFVGTIRVNPWAAGFIMERKGATWRPLTATTILPSGHRIPTQPVYLGDNIVIFSTVNTTDIISVAMKIRTPRIYLGRALEAKTAGNAVTYSLPGSNMAIDSGLTKGDVLYEQPDGSISSTKNFRPIALALSATETVLYGDDVPSEVYPE